MSDAITNAAILAQLTRMAEALEEQQRRLDALETMSRDNAAGPIRGAVFNFAPEVYPEDTQVEDGAPNRTSNVPNFHGIRAQELWKTETALSKEPFKCAFKLELAEDYMVWKFSMSRLLEKEGLFEFAMGTA